MNRLCFLAALTVPGCALDPKTIGSETEGVVSGSAEGSGDGTGGGTDDGSGTSAGPTGSTQGSADGSGEGGGTGGTQAGTDGSGTTDSTTSGVPTTCEELIAAFEAEAAAIRSCDAAAQCGQVLTGTSCGCTRNWVARLDADATMFYALLTELGQQECDYGLASPCDCPEADGYDCVPDSEGGGRRCTWNYL